MYEAFLGLGYSSVHQPAGRHQNWTVGRPHDDYIYPEDFGDLFANGPETIVECMLWRLILLAFPSAKVVLTVRDMNAWYDSISRHIDHIHSRLHHSDINHIHAADLCHQRIFGSAYPSRTQYTEAMHCHCLAVREFCRAERRPLLEFDPTIGEWGDLPAFCGRPTTAAPFPHENRSETGQ